MTVARLCNIFFLSITTTTFQLFFFFYYKNFTLEFIFLKNLKIITKKRSKVQQLLAVTTNTSVNHLIEVSTRGAHDMLRS